MMLQGGIEGKAHYVLFLLEVVSDQPRSILKPDLSSSERDQSY